MNNEIVREILSAYRPGGADAGDPRFAEALERCKADPELSQWLHGERSLDQNVAGALQGMAVPPGAKASLLATADVTQNNVIKAFFRRAQFGAIAAGLVIGIGGAVWAMQTSKTTTSDSLPLLAGECPSSQLVAWIDGLQSLDYKGNTSGEVLGWLSNTGAPIPSVLPAGLDVGSVNGCKVFQRDDGQPVTLICFMSRGELVHFFTWEAPAGDHPSTDVEPTWFSRATWNGASWSEGNQVYALMGRVDPEKIKSIILTRTKNTTV
jgi:hypothetical protein